MRLQPWRLRAQTRPRTRRRANLASRNVLAPAVLAFGFLKGGGLRAWAQREAIGGDGVAQRAGHGREFVGAEVRFGHRRRLNAHIAAAAHLLKRLAPILLGEAALGEMLDSVGTKVPAPDRRCFRGRAGELSPDQLTASF